jgi:eukaryotic-like serine/threonine-protein kinase
MTQTDKQHNEPKESDVASLETTCRLDGKGALGGGTTCRVKSGDETFASLGERVGTALGGMLEHFHFRAPKAKHSADSVARNTVYRPIEGPLKEGESTAAFEGNMSVLQERYDILKKFAEGGQGILSTAQDKVLRRVVALKSLRPEHLLNESVRRAFFNEALITAQLEHPAIVSVYSLLKDNGQGIHLAMKLVRGRTLKEILQADALELSHGRIKPQKYLETLHYHLEIFLRVCDAIAYAHARKVIHCDLKPENLMLGEYGETYVMDWGIARCLNQESTADQPLDGTPRFIPPEAYAGKPRDERTDIYALGLILFEIATLRPGYDVKNIPELIRQIREGRRNAVRNPYGVPLHPGLVAIIEKATAYDPEDRYQTVGEFSADIRSYLVDEPVSALPETPWMAMRRFLSRHLQVLLWGVAGCWVLALSVTLFSVNLALRNTVRERDLEISRGVLLGENNKILAYQQRLVKMSERTIRAAMALSQHFATLGGRLQRTAVMASFLCTHDFVATEKAPSLPIVDYRESRNPESPACGKEPSPVYYGKRINPEILSYVYGKDDASEEDRKAALAKIADIAPFLRWLVITSSCGDNVPLEQIPALQEEMLQKGFLVRRAYVGLEDPAIQVAYPYNPEYGDDYDNRRRPWYREAKREWQETGATNVVWGKPYRDAGENGRLLLACSVPILDEHGRFVGVLGEDVHIERLAGLLIENGNSREEGVTEKYLLNRREESLLRIDTTKTPDERNTEEFLMDSASLPASVLKFIHETTEPYGVQEWTTPQGERELYFFAYLPGGDSCVVERADQATVLSLSQGGRAGGDSVHVHGPGCLGIH